MGRFYNIRLLCGCVTLRLSEWWFIFCDFFIYNDVVKTTYLSAIKINGVIVSGKYLGI